jgi:hypothetical protein
MTTERRAALLRHLRVITCARELDAFRAALRETGEARDAELFTAMEKRADTFARRQA